ERLPTGVGTLLCDRTDHAALRATLARERVDALVDIAYAPTTGADVEAVLEALAGRLGHALFVSTGRVYDHALPIPYSEATPRNLHWGEYAKNKIAGEDALMRWHHARGLPVTIVRPTHVYGPMNTRNNETFVFDRLVRGRPVLLPGAGGWLRQFGHVEDLADALAAMLGVAAAFGHAYNVTGEEAITQVGFVELIADVVKRPPTLVHVDTPPGGTPVPFGQNLVYGRHAERGRRADRGHRGPLRVEVPAPPLREGGPAQVAPGHGRGRGLGDRPGAPTPRGHHARPGRLRAVDGRVRHRLVCVDHAAH